MCFPRVLDTTSEWSMMSAIKAALKAMVVALQLVVPVLTMDYIHKKEETYPEEVSTTLDLVRWNF